MNIDLSALVTGREVSLPEMLDAREHRQEVQRMLISSHHLPVISFTLNIVGPIKVFPLALRAFHEGVRLIETQCHAWKIPVIATHSIESHTGYEYFWAVDRDVRSVKEILCLLEDSVALGRLFDIDVIQPDGQKISRTDLGFAGRKCLICNQDAFVCSRARVHSVKELLEKECQIMGGYFAEQHAKKLSSLSMQALLYEVSVTPKPGLVDRSNTGSHKDMDIFTFEASAVSLNHYFEKFALCGIDNSHEPYSRIFARLRSLGIQAEDTMYKATDNVNTHKGLIFSLAIMNCSLGYMYANRIPYSPENLLDINRKLVADVLEDFEHVTADSARTNGERLYALYGMKGARGEALSGYGTVLCTALPVMRSCIRKGLSINDAGAITLLHIMAYSEDTNIVNRSSYETMKEIQNALRRKLEGPDMLRPDAMGLEMPGPETTGPDAPGPEMPELNAPGLVCQDYTAYLEALDRIFIEHNISPGGSADLLALTYFIYLYEEAGLSSTL